MKFGISYKASGRNIKKFILDFLITDKVSYDFVEKRLKTAGYRNIDAFLDALIFDIPVAAIVIIDKTSTELENVLGQLTMDTDIIEFQTFVDEEERIHKFMPFNEEIRDIEEGTKKMLMLRNWIQLLFLLKQRDFNLLLLKPMHGGQSEYHHQC